MNRVRFTLLLLSLLVPFAQPMADDDDHGRKARPIAALTLPLAGTAVDAAGQRGVFSGTITINRFVGNNQHLMAVGIVRGTVTDLAGQVIRTGLQDVMLPVSIGQRTVSLAMPPSAAPRLIRVSSTEAQSGRFILAQAQSCGILHLAISGDAVDLLGVTVNLSPITLDISGDAAGPLGALVCEVVKLLGTAANVVGLLNNLLGTLTGLLGGLGL
ncbi:MAG TPA: hypothetical protein VEQ87_04660 [Burkholderiales bacterium]|nr:hypothetical protein [Burkholderiales bacterium]